jgi:chorismate synthase
VLDGVPPGLPIDAEAVQARMNQRRPGLNILTTQRAETDSVQFQTGVYEGHTTGAPMTLWIDNDDTRSKDYSKLLRTPRPGHSDYVAGIWANGNQDHRGGGHYSGRLTAPLVAAAAAVAPMLAQHGITVGAHLDTVGPLKGDAHPDAAQMNKVAAGSMVHTAHTESDDDFVAAIEDARKAGDSLGGVISWRADGVPIALGDPFFDSIESQLAHIFFAVPAVKGVDFGAGFASATMSGSQHNDGYAYDGATVTTTSNHSGGILGGRSTGMPLHGRVAIKPTSSIFKPQATVDLTEQVDATLNLKGRHDPCIAIRAVPVIRACVELCLADFILQARSEGHLKVPS